MKIEKIEIKNLHHRFDITLNHLYPGLNVVHAENGAGKTTVLHIIANLLNGDLSRFLFLDFDLISVWFSGQAGPITIQSEGTKDESRIIFKL
ncbi:AAA family ATPase [Nitrosomonas sp. Nm33]|uniref:AAA family ATPase n=1 Tax=Nitrosomonas sp. Nm33 TaxID=133724 RepID=UPI0008952A4A|nr:AAA family ATPase [Nitrosomonas sp. Nm33]SDY34032.1 AAA domain-containing protein [Nitrosomonas sp. Nm33]